MQFAEFFVFLLILPSVAVILVETILRSIYLIALTINSNSMPKLFVPTTTKGWPKILFLFPVRNEDEIIGKTIEKLRQTIIESNMIGIVVVADHCSDQTTTFASLAGAQVVARFDGHPGKGPAISWFAQNYEHIVNAHDIVVILDADTLVDKDFYSAIRNAFATGINVLQSFVFPIRSDNNVLATLASYSELLSEYVDDVARSKLGWHIPLRGTGMAFRSTIFCSQVSNLITQVEDIELSIRLARRGMPIIFASNVIIYDPKSSQMIGLARQRGRWLKGQRHIVSVMKNDLWKLILSGVSGWSLIQALMFKPKTLIIAIKVILVFLLWSFSFELLGYVLFVILLISFFIDFGYYFIGLKYVDDPKLYLFALFKTPIYFLLWLTGWMYSILPGRGWLRGRDK